MKIRIFILSKKCSELFCEDIFIVRYMYELSVSKIMITFVFFKYQKNEIKCERD